LVDWTSAIINLILGAIIGAIFIHIGAKLAKIDGATFMKAFEVALIGAILSLIFSYASATYGSIIAWILVIPVIKFIYDTTWGKAIIAWIIYFIALVIVVALIVALIVGAAFAIG